MVRESVSKLSHQKIPLNELIVTQTLSRELDQYRVPSPVARAAMQLQAAGKNIRMGQRIQFIYTKTEEGVHAWDLPDEFNPALIDVLRYKELLFRAVHEVLQPMGIPEIVVRDWMFREASYMTLDDWLKSHSASEIRSAFICKSEVPYCTMIAKHRVLSNPRRLKSRWSLIVLVRSSQRIIENGLFLSLSGLFVWMYTLSTYIIRYLSR